MDISSSCSTVIDIPPSAVAFCPSHPEYYVVGTYFLHRTAEGEQPSDAPQKRTGTLILYRLEGTQLYVGTSLVEICNLAIMKQHLLTVDAARTCKQCL